MELEQHRVDGLFGYGYSSSSDDEAQVKTFHAFKEPWTVSLPKRTMMEYNQSIKTGWIESRSLNKSNTDDDAEFYHQESDTQTHRRNSPTTNACRCKGLKSIRPVPRKLTRVPPPQAQPRTSCDHSEEPEPSDKTKSQAVSASKRLADNTMVTTNTVTTPLVSGATLKTTTTTTTMIVPPPNNPTNESLKSPSMVTLSTSNPKHGDNGFREKTKRRKTRPHHDTLSPPQPCASIPPPPMALDNETDQKQHQGEQTPAIPLPVGGNASDLAKQATHREKSGKQESEQAVRRTYKRGGKKYKGLYYCSVKNCSAVYKGPSGLFYHYTHAHPGSAGTFTPRITSTRNGVNPMAVSPPPTRDEIQK
eukprot:m.67202 g.67202  ORF g.67202 m.67202 type:complete len:362 (-) comp23778_c1_seq2:123-1208(-)